MMKYPSPFIKLLESLVFIGIPTGEGVKPTLHHSESLCLLAFQGKR